MSASKEEGNPIREGIVAVVHSLKSTSGLKINGKRALILRHRPDQGRWQVCVEGEHDYHSPKALKGANLTPIRRLPFPTGDRRGFADIDIHGEKIVCKLCELLLYDKDGSDFSPSDIMFTGYAFMALDRIGQYNFTNFYATQMEQMGGVLALGNLCRETEEPGTEAAVFALLEGNDMYIDVLIQTMHCTNLIIEEGEDEQPGFSYCPLAQLTPDQDSAPYVRTMKEGPVLILECVAKCSFAPALWAALANSEFYHLLIQRLLRWVAREAKKTLDGKGLGRKGRSILSSMFPEIAVSLKKPILDEAADNILVEASSLLNEPSSVTALNLRCLLSAEDSPTMN